MNDRTKVLSVLQEIAATLSTTIHSGLSVGVHPMIIDRGKSSVLANVVAFSDTNGAIVPVIRYESDFAHITNSGKFFPGTVGIPCSGTTMRVDSPEEIMKFYSTNIDSSVINELTTIFNSENLQTLAIVKAISDTLVPPAEFIKQSDMSTKHLGEPGEPHRNGEQSGDKNSWGEFEKMTNKPAETNRLSPAFPNQEINTPYSWTAVLRFEDGDLTLESTSPITLKSQHKKGIVFGKNVACSADSVVGKVSTNGVVDELKQQVNGEQRRTYPVKYDHTTAFGKAVDCLHDELLRGYPSYVTEYMDYSVVWGDDDDENVTITVAWRGQTEYSMRVPKADILARSQEVRRKILTTMVDALDLDNIVVTDTPILGFVMHTITSPLLYDRQPIPVPTISMIVPKV